MEGIFMKKKSSHCGLCKNCIGYAYSGKGELLISCKIYFKEKGLYFFNFYNERIVTRDFLPNCKSFIEVYNFAKCYFKEKELNDHAKSILDNKIQISQKVNSPVKKNILFSFYGDYFRQTSCNSGRSAQVLGR
jgi:hypothetical protein